MSCWWWLLNESYESVYLEHFPTTHRGMITGWPWMWLPYPVSDRPHVVGDKFVMCKTLISATWTDHIIDGGKNTFLSTPQNPQFSLKLLLIIIDIVMKWTVWCLRRKRSKLTQFCMQIIEFNIQMSKRQRMWDSLSRHTCTYQTQSKFTHHLFYNTGFPPAFPPSPEALL